MNYDYSFTEYDSLCDGWRIGFGKFWLEDIREAAIKSNYLDKLYFVQIKEKFGQLRTYTNGAPKEICDVIDKYEYISEHVCIHCGSPHATLVDTGWVIPVCRECWDRQNERAVKRGFRKEKLDYDTYVCDKDEEGLRDKYYITQYYEDNKTTTEVDISDTVQKIYKAYDKRQRRKHRQ